MPDKPLVSVITPVRNAGASLSRCLDSVQSQTYEKWEHIVIDGASTDNTVEILCETKRHNLWWISEPDRGIYHAMNKGVAKAKGTIIVILNADDWFYPDALSMAVRTLLTSKAQATCGVVHRDKAGSIQSTLDLSAIYGNKPWLSMPMPHISVFAYRSLYEQWGVFDERYRLAADFELVSRWRSHGVCFALVEDPLGVAELGGATSGKGAFKVIEEFRQISVLYGAHPLRAWMWYVQYWCKWQILNLVPQVWIRWWLSCKGKCMPPKK